MYCCHSGCPFIVYHCQKNGARTFGQLRWFRCLVDSEKLLSILFYSGIRDRHNIATRKYWQLRISVSGWLFQVIVDSILFCLWCSPPSPQSAYTHFNPELEDAILTFPQQFWVCYFSIYNEFYTHITFKFFNTSLNCSYKYCKNSFNSILGVCLIRFIYTTKGMHANKLEVMPYLHALYTTQRILFDITVKRNIAGFRFPW